MQLITRIIIISAVVTSWISGMSETPVYRLPTVHLSGSTSPISCLVAVKIIYLMLLCKKQRDPFMIHHLGLSCDPSFSTLLIIIWLYSGRLCS